MLRLQAVTMPLMGMITLIMIIFQAAGKEKTFRHKSEGLCIICQELNDICSVFFFDGTDRAAVQSIFCFFQCFFRNILFNCFISVFYTDQARVSSRAILNFPVAFTACRPPLAKWKFSPALIL